MLQHFRVADCVFEDGMSVVDERSLVVRPVLRERALLAVAVVGEGALGIRPTGAVVGPDRDIALHPGRLRPFDLGQRVAPLDEFARPAAGEAQRVEVVDHVALLVRAHVDGEALVGQRFGGAAFLHDRAGPEGAADRFALGRTGDHGGDKDDGGRDTEGEAGEKRGGTRLHKH